MEDLLALYSSRIFWIDYRNCSNSIIVVWIGNYPQGKASEIQCLSLEDDDLQAAACFHTEVSSTIFRVITALCFSFLSVVQALFGIKIVHIDQQRYEQYLQAPRETVAMVNIVLTICFATRAIYQLLAVCNLFVLPDVLMDASGDVPLSIFVIFEAWVYLPTYLIISRITSSQSRGNVQIFRNFVGGSRNRYSLLTSPEQGRKGSGGYGSMYNSQSEEEVDEESLLLPEDEERRRSRDKKRSRNNKKKARRHDPSGSKTPVEKKDSQSEMIPIQSSPRKEDENNPSPPVAENNSGSDYSTLLVSLSESKSWLTEPTNEAQRYWRPRPAHFYAQQPASLPSPSAAPPIDSNVHGYHSYTTSGTINNPYLTSGGTPGVVGILPLGLKQHFQRMRSSSMASVSSDHEHHAHSHNMPLPPPPLPGFASDGPVSPLMNPPRAPEYELQVEPASPLPENRWRDTPAAHGIAVQSPPPRPSSSTLTVVIGENNSSFDAQAYEHTGGDHMHAASDNAPRHDLLVSPSAIMNENIIGSQARSDDGLLFYREANHNNTSSMFAPRPTRRLYAIDEGEVSSGTPSNLPLRNGTESSNITPQSDTVFSTTPTVLLNTSVVAGQPGCHIVHTFYHPSGPYPHTVSMSNGDGFSRSYGFSHIEHHRQASGNNNNQMASRSALDDPHGQKMRRTQSLGFT
eukprot:scaffold7968_cov240-Ochromonas_danica.AAC.4